MPYLYETLTTPSEIDFALAHTPLRKAPEGTTKVEVYASSFSDPGPDYCRFVCKNEQDEVIGTTIQPGY